MNYPLVSICIPTRNGSKFIEEAILSALNQDYSNLEIIVSDDASTDSTLDIIKKNIRDYSIPVHIYHHKPSGIGSNWNHCIEKANGEYVKFLFQDDIHEPDCISGMMEIALTNERIGLVFCKRKIQYNKQDQSQSAWVDMYQNVHSNWTSLTEIQSGRELLNDKNLLKEPQNKVGEPTAVLLKKEVFATVGYFNTKLKQALDLEFWFRVFTKFDVVFVNSELVSFRLHENQASAQNVNEKIIDHNLYPKLLFRNCFMYLHKNVRRDLFYRTTLLGKFIFRIKNRGKKLFHG